MLLGLQTTTASSSGGGRPGWKLLPGHLSGLPTHLTAIGQLARTNRLRLAIGLPLRDEKGLEQFLAQTYDPASPAYRHYLTPEEFAGRFGPSAEDYQRVIEFAQSQGMVVRATHRNRLLLDVEASADSVQGAFHVALRSYRHPTERREFYAPDAEPSVGADLPIADISGLNNYLLPHPKYRKRPARLPKSVVARSTGSSPTGAYMGNDFRAAYLPGVTLTGTGQMVGLVQFDGFYPGDIAAYETAAGLPAVPIQTVLLDGFSGTPTTGADSGNVEVSLDIEMAMAMAPGLSKIVVFEAGPSGYPNDVLNAMAASNQIKQLSCSWGWSGGPSTTTDNIFKQMAAQGQSFFNASGDSDAFTTGASSANGVDNPSLQNAPSSSPYITMVGGTTLTTTGPGGAWSSETVWNWGLDGGSYVGSSGGISSYYSLPSWQGGLSMSANGGSTSYRNIPDVALTADNVYVLYANGSSDTLGGTSCAAPLWAGLTALINQQAAASGKSSVGFLNPALYGLGQGATYGQQFHDITAGNNVSSDSPNAFYAVSGYDLCTGWGTPQGQALINALAGATNALVIAPASGFTASGPVGGPFNSNAVTLSLTNFGSSALNWSLASTSLWLGASPVSGALAAGASTQVSAGLTTSAQSLAPGTYNSSLLVSNHSGGTVEVPFALLIGQSLVQNGGFETGSFSSWTLVGNTTIRRNVYNAVESTTTQYAVTHSGNYGAFLGDIQLATLSQPLATVPGQYYLISLWVENPIAGSGQQFYLNWNTNSAANAVFSLPSPPAFGWSNVQCIVRATGTNTLLAIQAENDPDYFGLDDISVIPIPEPRFQNFAPVSNGVQLAWNTCTGLVYQVQYRTNLLQTNWLPLNAAFAATNYSSLLLDPAVTGAARQRFYRLSVAP